MSWTNVANLPQPLVDAIMFSDYDIGEANISVTGLIQPPRIRQLMKRHKEEIVEDVSEGIWRLIGSIGHKILERSNTDNHLSEERLTTQVNGWTVSGKADLLGPDMILDDYKLVSVWAMKDLKPEFEQQLNLYALLYRANGFEAKAARIIAILRDWSKAKAKREPDYPQVGVVVKEVPLHSPAAQELLLDYRVSVHQEAEELPDDELPYCTDAETWKKPEVWAVKKPRSKRAWRLFDHKPTNEDVESFPGNDMDIERRPDQYPRCESYCPVSQWCNQNLERQNFG